MDKTMTDIDDYRFFLKGKLKSAQSILDDAEKRKSEGEITKSNYISMWRKEVSRIKRDLAIEETNPILFSEEAGIWKKREAFPLH